MTFNLLSTNDRTPLELRLALRSFAEELPSEAQLRRVRRAIATAVDEPVPLRWDEVPAELSNALGDHRSELPSWDQVDAMRSKLPRITTRRFSRFRGRPALLIAALVLGTGVAAAYLAHQRTLKVHGDGTPLPATTAPDTPAATIPASDRAGPSETAVVEPSAPDPTRTKQRAAPPLSELHLIRNARSALARSPASALMIANSHARHYPKGVLGQEREAVAIEALLKLKQRTGAQARLDKFRIHHPNSVHIPRLERLLGEAIP